MNQRNQNIIDAIFFSHCFSIFIDLRGRVYREYDEYHWYVIDGECRASGDYFVSVMKAQNWDQVVARFKHIRKTAYCINVDRLNKYTAKVYDIPWLLEEKNYVNMNKYTPAEY